MEYSTLISVNDLYQHLDDPGWAIIDCRATLDNPLRGQRDFISAHVPSAVYASLDTDLAGAVQPGVTGRHPLPPVEPLVKKFSNWGIDSAVQVVAYDDAPGIGLSTAPRLWWMLRWLGHDKVAVLDGGWVRWVSQGMPLQAGEMTRPARKFIPSLQSQLLADSAWVDQMRLDPHFKVIDSRSADRYRGENETIDPVAGHVPGAVCLPYLENFSSEGLFLSPQKLRHRFEAVTKEITPGNIAFYCGSGVTAANNVLAFAHAGLGDARLYAGSWSEWITDPRHAVEK